jgi:putative hydrolase of the HAD superfamily
VARDCVATLKNQQMVKAVIFDLGRVIVPFDFKRGYAKLAPLCGLAVADIPRRIGTTDLVQRYESGTIQSRDFVRELSSHLKFETTYENFCEIWSSIFLPETLIPESMLEGIARNYRLVLLSNTNEIHFEMIRENYPLLRHFDEFVLSYEVGAMKPLPLIYERAIEAARCAPGECFYTDDIPAYVEGGRVAGIDAVLFESAEQIARELRDRDVSW